VTDFVGSTLFVATNFVGSPPDTTRSFLMNKNVLFVTVAATAIIAGAGLASAQTMSTEQPKASAPMKSDSEKAGQSAQSPKKDADKAQTTGQGPKAEDAKKAQDSKPQTNGQAPKAEDAKKAQDSKPQTTGQAPKAEDAKKAQDSKPPTTGQAPKAEDAKKESGTQQGQAGQAGGGAQAPLSTEQRTQIRQTVMQVGGAPRVSSVTFSLSVGTVVPRTVKYAPLPPRVVEIYPAWRGYHFFIVGDQIVIVESGSLRIVAVSPA
jgi:type IV secretory pathway VirB10-like protein